MVRVIALPQPGGVCSSINRHNPPQTDTNPWNQLHNYVYTDKKSADDFVESWSYVRKLYCRCRKSEQVLDSIQINTESEEAFRESCRMLHNAINTKLQADYPSRYYPQVSREEYDVLWKGIAPRKSNRAIVTVAGGIEYKKQLRISRETFKAYAEKHNADYIEITNEKYRDWKKNKIRTGEIASQYEQTLFLDVDCIITDKCQDLFQYKGIAIVDDWNTLVRNRRYDWIFPEICCVCQSQKVAEPEYWERALNTGVVLCTNKDNPWVMPTEDLPPMHCSEQVWVDYHINEFVSLPETCNWQWWRGSDFWRGIPKAEIIHFANCSGQERLDLMQWAYEEYGMKEGKK
jgi:hypothetical protein